MTTSFYISSAYGATLVILLGLAVTSFIQRRQLRQKQMQALKK